MLTAGLLLSGCATVQPLAPGLDDVRFLRLKTRVTQSRINAMAQQVGALERLAGEASAIGLRAQAWEYARISASYANTARDMTRQVHTMRSQAAAIEAAAAIQAGRVRAEALRGGSAPSGMAEWELANIHQEIAEEIRTLRVYADQVDGQADHISETSRRLLQQYAH